MSLPLFTAFFFDLRHNPRRQAGPRKVGTNRTKVIYYIKITWLRTMVTGICLEGGVVECEHLGTVNLG